MNDHSSVSPPSIEDWQLRYLRDGHLDSAHDRASGIAFQLIPLQKQSDFNPISYAFEVERNAGGAMLNPYCPVFVVLTYLTNGSSASTVEEQTRHRIATFTGSRFTWEIIDPKDIWVESLIRYIGPRQKIPKAPLSRVVVTVRRK